MIPYELTNDQRAYFGLVPVAADWEKHRLSELVTVYFEKNTLVKVLNYGWGYQEYDTDISTRDRSTLLPRSAKGKEQKLTIPKLLKINGCGVQFSGSFEGGGIHVFHNKRKVFFIKSFFEEGEIRTFEDIENWIFNFQAKIPLNYFEWLRKQLSQKRMKVKVLVGDIFAFQVAHSEYGFGRVLLDVFEEKKKGQGTRPELYWIHPRSLIVAPYAFYSSTLDINVDDLILKSRLPNLCIFDSDIYRGEMPVIGNRPLNESEKEILFPSSKATSLTIRYTKTDIETFIATNRS